MDASRLSRGSKAPGLLPAVRSPRTWVDSSAAARQDSSNRGHGDIGFGVPAAEGAWDEGLGIGGLAIEAQTRFGTETCGTGTDWQYGQQIGYLGVQQTWAVPGVREAALARRSSY